MSDVLPGENKGHHAEAASAQKEVLGQGTTSYDLLPYESAPYPHSRPERLATLATLLGLTPPNPSEARVLELGCGFGGNLMPLAELYPRSQFVGLDASLKQIAGGKAIADRLGLTNLQLVAMDLMQVGPDFVQFDYIIAHGIYSWVPPEVQKKILQICSQHLSPNGLAYVSYNTYPGWRMRSIVRDMMQYRTRKLDNPSQRAAQARSMIALFAQTGARLDEPYWQLLMRDMSIVGSDQKQDYYIAHEYLEDQNAPCYFHEFAQRAGAEGLQYLGEANPFSRPALGHVAREALSAIETVSANTLEQEQYLDFVCNRAFRASVLCHANLRLNWNFDSRWLVNLHVSSPAQPQDPNPDVRSPTNVSFHSPRGMTTTTSEPVVKALLLALSKCWPASVPYRELIAAAASLVRGKPQAVETGIHDEPSAKAVFQILQLYGISQLDLSVCPTPCTASPSQSPRATALARLQAAESNVITNLRHEPTRVSDLDRRIIPMLDGQHDLNQMTSALIKLAESGAVKINNQGKTIHPGPQLRPTLQSAVAASLEDLGKTALLLGDTTEE